MIYPIVAYGDPVLKTPARDLDPEDSSIDLKKLIEDMFETMYHASGVGLAAPQIGLDLRIFVIDSDKMDDEEPGVKQAFINPQILEESGEKWPYEEGCLSIPDIREDVQRQERLIIKYFDENWEEYEEEFTGMNARVIQHEYDHIQGILFTDYLSAFKKRLLRSKLHNISRGKVKVQYKMRFPIRK